MVDDDTKLNDCWTFWYDNPKLAPPSGEWKDSLHPCATVDTIESFWRVYNNLRPASHLSINSNYSVFRRGIEPCWEDPSNREGGKFVFNIPKKESKSGKIDEYWLMTVLAVLGETMDPTGDQVLGVVFSIRKGQHRIALWLRSNQKTMCVPIGERWKKVLNLELVTAAKSAPSIPYQTHKDAAASGRSFRNEAVFEV